MASRIRMVSETTEEYEAIQARLVETASNTYRPLAEAQEAYIRTSDALKSLGYNTEGALDVTDSLSYLFVTNAASGGRAANAVTAFGKAIQTGKIEVDTWQSLLAAVPSMVKGIAGASGKSAEEIRKLGVTGRLAVSELTEGLRRSFLENARLAKEMPMSAADAFTRLKNNIQVAAGKMDEAGGITRGFAGAMEALGKHAVSLMTAGLVTLDAVAALYTARIGAAIVATGKKAAASLLAVRADRARTQASLASARADILAAQAAVAAAAADKTAATGTTARTGAHHALTAANARLAASERALATASAAASASKGVFGAARSRLSGILAGPWGIAVTAAIGLLGSFSDGSGKPARPFRGAGREHRKIRQALQGTAGFRDGLARTGGSETLDAFRTAGRELERLAASQTGAFLDLWRGYDQTTIQAISRFRRLVNQAVATGAGDFDAMTEAIGQMGGVSEETLDQLRMQVGALEALEGKAAEAGKAIRVFTAAQKKLSGSEDDSGKPVETLSKSLLAAREAAKALWVELSGFSDSVSPEFEEVGTHLDALIERFDTLSESGIDMGAVLNDALTKSLAKAKNPADLTALVGKIEQLGEAGRLAKPKMIELFEAVRTKAKGAGGEAAKLREEIEALLRQANAVRSGKSGYGAKAENAQP